MRSPHFFISSCLLACSPKLADSGGFADVLQLREPLGRGEAVGRCARLIDGVPVVGECPEVIDAFIRSYGEGKDAPSKETGIFRTNLSLIFPNVALGVDSVVLVANETLILGSNSVRWVSSEDVPDAALDTLLLKCRGSDFDNLAIVTREHIGCSVSMLQVNASARQPVWRLRTLAHRGQRFGNPENFWADAPTSRHEPKNPSCGTPSVIRIKVQKFKDFCAEHVEILDAQRKIAEAAAQIESLRRALENAASRPGIGPLLQIITSYITLAENCRKCSEKKRAGLLRRFAEDIGREAAKFEAFDAALKEDLEHVNKRLLEIARDLMNDEATEVMDADELTPKKAAAGQ